MSRIARITTAAVLVGLVQASSTAWACNNAEKLRLADELKSLAQKNAWAGVERKYDDIKKTKCDLSAKIQMIAADSAQNLGKTYERWERLAAANEVEPNDAVSETISGIETTYGRIDILGDPRRPAPLLREAMPFAPDQRKSIEWAQKVVENTGSFKGMLPAGEYKVADKTFIVVPGNPEFIEVKIGKGKRPSGGSQVPTGDKPLINWSGPVATVGVGLWGTSAPNRASVLLDGEAITGPASTGQNASGETIVCPKWDPNGGDDGQGGFSGESDVDRVLSDTPNEEQCARTERQPGDIPMGFNIDVQLGYEVGLTYRKPELGAVVTVNGRFNFHTNIHQVYVFGGLLMRPGDFRITAGPTYGLVMGSATGAAEWVDEGQDADFRRTQQKTWRLPGLAGGGGFAGSFGWAPLKLGPFQGVIELHGNTMWDNRRNYTGFGLRFGIVPKIERFEG